MNGQNEVADLPTPTPTTNRCACCGTPIDPINRAIQFYGLHSVLNAFLAGRDIRQQPFAAPADIPAAMWNGCVTCAPGFLAGVDICLGIMGDAVRCRESVFKELTAIREGKRS